MSELASAGGAWERERWAEAGLLAPGLIHEMRHPLMGIKAALQLLERRLGAGVASEEAWGLMTAQVLRLEEMLRGYEDFLRPGSVSPRAFGVQPVVRRAVGLLGWRLRGLGEAFSLELPEGAVAVSGTPEALLHALTNLLVNALDANEEAGGGRRLAVRLLVLEGQGRVQVRISDEGTGISSEVARRLFEPRFTTKPAGRGTGLGLSVARRLMAEVGGAVRLVEPDDPRRLAWARTEFCVELTAAPGAPEEAARPVLEPARAPLTPPPLPLPTPVPLAASAHPPTPVPLAASAPLPTPVPLAASAPVPLTPAPLPPMPPVAPTAARVREGAARILVVDDEPIILLLLEKALGLEGHSVVTASRGEEAAGLLRAERFELLVTDKNLPGPGGVELATLARTLNPDMGILLTTAYATRESALALLRLQADAYLTKPFDTEVLVEHVRQTLARRRSLARLRELHEEAPAVARVQAALLVAPDAADRALLTRHLQRMGLQVRGAEDVLAGLRATPPVDALVVPAGLLGSEARAEIRQMLVRRPGFRVVVISEPQSLGDSITAIAVGAREQLVRPLGEAEVRRVLAAALSPASGGAP